MTTRSRPIATFLVLAAILVAGALLRASYLSEIVRAPDFAAPLADSAFHDYWARGLRSGEWAPPAGELDPRIPETPFQRPPGYSYFLAAVYALTGGSFLGARIAQLALGLLNVGLAFLLGRLLFSRTVGLVLAALVSTYWAFVYFEGELHAPVLVTTANLATLLALVAWARRPRAARAFVAGLAVGVGALVQANALLFAPVGALFMALGGSRVGATRSAAVRSAVVFLVGTIVAVAPATIRNWIVAKELVVVGSNGPITLYVGNNDEADGVSARIPYLRSLPSMSGWSWFSYDRLVEEISHREGLPRKYSAVADFFTKEALQFMREHPHRFVALTTKRALLFWGPDEVANNKAVRADKAASRTLRHLPGLPWYLSLSVAGAGALFLQERRRPPKAPLSGDDRAAEARLDPATRLALVGCALFILVYFLSFVPFLAAARFRAPILPAVFLFGAWGIVRFAGAIRRRTWRPVVLAACAWAVLLVACRHSFYPTAFDEAWWHTDRAAALLRTHQVDEAARELELALQANPGYVDAHVAIAGILEEQGRPEEAIAHYREVLAHRSGRPDLRFRLGLLLLGARRFDEAVTELEEVVRANPTAPPAQFELGRALIEAGRPDEGLEALRLSLQFDPAQPAAHVNIGILLERRGDHEGALAEYSEALAIDAGAADAHREMARSLRALGRLADAEHELLEVSRLRPQAIESSLLLGDFYFAQKRYDEAATWYGRAIAIDARNMMARVNFASALSNAGKYPEAVRALEETVALDPGNRVAQERLRVLRDYLSGTPGGAVRGG